MGERSELFVLSMITRRIMQAHRTSAEEFGIETEPTEQKKVLITIEEAQRVLGAGGSTTQIFRECAMEGRKFGVGLCVVTQQPKNIDQKVLAQINTFVVMGLGDRGDRDIIMGSAKQDLSKMEIEIQTLDQGEAIISTIGIPFPVSTRIHKFEDYVNELNREKKTENYRRSRHRVFCKKRIGYGGYFKKIFQVVLGIGKRFIKYLIGFPQQVRKRQQVNAIGTFHDQPHHWRGLRVPSFTYFSSTVPSGRVTRIMIFWT